jgi:heme exporter protein C
MHRFANPGRFLRLAERVLPWCVGVSAVSIAVGLYLALFVAPADYQQSESVRIMYVHVPSAWMALFVYTNIAVASAVALIWRHPLADLAAKASSPVGAGFTFLALLYLGHMALMNAFDDPARGRKAAAVLAKFSVDWWNTLHQPSSVLRMTGPSIHPDMLWPLLLMGLGFTFYYLSLLLIRMKSELVAARIRALHRLAMERPTDDPGARGALSGETPGTEKLDLDHSGEREIG